MEKRNQNCGNSCDEFETNSYDGICELCYINKYPNLDKEMKDTGYGNGNGVIR